MQHKRGQVIGFWAEQAQVTRVPVCGEARAGPPAPDLPAVHRGPHRLRRYPEVMRGHGLVSSRPR